MTTQFEFRLMGASVPDGELEADQLIAIVASLKGSQRRSGASKPTRNGSAGHRSGPSGLRS